MKTGLALPELVTELERQHATKADYVRPTRDLRLNTQQNGSIFLEMRGLDNEFALTAHAHSQFAADLSIPKPYYDRMRIDAPELLTRNVNHWLHAQSRERMVRTLDGSVRAWLSNRYRRLDNWDMIPALLPAIQRLDGDYHVESAQFTETRLYLKLVTPRFQGEVKRGDVVQAGLVVSNSEVGGGAISVESLLYRLVCLNGMIAADATRRNHVGKYVGAHDNPLYRDETLAADDRAFWLAFRDTVEGTLSDEGFQALLAQVQETTEREITGDPVQAVQAVADRYAFTDAERGDVLRALIRGGDLTQYGAIQAVTLASQTAEDYERATEFERVGGKILDLKPGEWSVIANGRTDDVPA